MVALGILICRSDPDDRRLESGVACLLAPADTVAPIPGTAAMTAASKSRRLSASVSSFEIVDESSNGVGCCVSCGSGRLGLL